MVNHLWDGTHPAQTACADDFIGPETVPHVSVRELELVSCPECEKVGRDRQVEGLAFDMFTRNMSEYGFDPGVLHIEWATDEGLREFWHKQARGVLEFLGQSTGITA